MAFLQAVPNSRIRYFSLSRRRLFHFENSLVRYSGKIFRICHSQFPQIGGIWLVASAPDVLFPPPDELFLVVQLLANRGFKCVGYGPIGSWPKNWTSCRRPPVQEGSFLAVLTRHRQEKGTKMTPHPPSPKLATRKLWLDAAASISNRNYKTKEAAN